MSQSLESLNERGWISRADPLFFFPSFSFSVSLIDKCDAAVCSFSSAGNSLIPSLLGLVQKWNFLGCANLDALICMRVYDWKG